MNTNIITGVIFITSGDPAMDYWKAMMLLMPESFHQGNIPMTGKLTMNFFCENRPVAFLSRTFTEDAESIIICDEGGINRSGQKPLSFSITFRVKKGVKSLEVLARQDFLTPAGNEFFSLLRKISEMDDSFIDVSGGKGTLGFFQSKSGAWERIS